MYGFAHHPMLWWLVVVTLAFLLTLVLMTEPLHGIL